jgi:argininosuccinate lyase
MSNLFTLESIREEADRSFRPVVITLSDGTECVLSNLLRLPKKSRLEVTKLLKKLEHLEGEQSDELESDDVDVFLDTASEILSIVGDKGKKLVAEIGGDLTVTMKVMEKWMESTQSGEASGSDS